MARKNDKKLPDVPSGDHNILKFMLKTLYGRDRDDLATRLVERFGDASGVFMATHEELMSVCGITERVATFFNIMYPLKRRVALDALPKDITDGRVLDGFAAAMLASEPYAVEVAVYLDGDGALICAERLPETERIRAAVAGVCRHDAQKFVWISHTPYGGTRTADEIAELARTIVRLQDLLDIFGVEFVEHVELSDGKTSRRASESGFERDIRGERENVERSVGA